MCPQEGVLHKMNAPTVRSQRTRPTRCASPSTSRRASGPAPTHYWLYREWENDRVLGGSHKTAGWTVCGLKAGESYAVQVQARNEDCGKSEFEIQQGECDGPISDKLEFTTAIGAESPPPPNPSPPASSPPPPPPSTSLSPPPSPSPPPGTEPVGEGAAALVEALGFVNYEFKRLKSTAPTGACDIDASETLCWEDSRIYKWKDMIAAVQKMATTGVMGRKLYTDGTSVKGSLANLAAFLAQTLQETIQYDARDENNWSDAAVAASGRRRLPGNGGVRPARPVVWQLPVRRHDHRRVDGSDVRRRRRAVRDRSEYGLGRAHDGMVRCARPLLRAHVADPGGAGTTAGGARRRGRRGTRRMFGRRRSTRPRGDVFFGPYPATDHVPPEVLATKTDYIEYLKGAIDSGSGEACLMEGTPWTTRLRRRGRGSRAPAGARTGQPHPPGGRRGADVEGCCWWGRGVIQTTGVCNFGKLNFFAGKKAADAGRSSLYPSVDFCADPGVICRDDHPDLKWVAGFFYWLESVQSYDEGGGSTGRERGVYMDVLKAWVDNGARLSDTSLVDFASGVVNRAATTRRTRARTAPTCAATAKCTPSARAARTLPP